MKICGSQPRSISHYLGTCSKYTLSGSTADLLSQNFWRAAPGLFVLTKSPGDSFCTFSMKTIVVKQRFANCELQAKSDNYLVFKIKFYWNAIMRFLLWRKNWVVLTETIETVNMKLFTVWPLIINIFWPLPYRKRN